MPSARCRLLVVAMVFAWAAAGCRATPAAGTPPTVVPPAAAAPAAGSSQSKVRTELYFGRGRKGAPEVSEAEWAAFLDEVVTPLFPAGFTVVDARRFGQESVIRSNQVADVDF